MRLRNKGSVEGRLIGVGRRNKGDAELKMRGIYVPCGHYGLYLKSLPNSHKSVLTELYHDLHAISFTIDIINVHRPRGHSGPSSISWAMTMSKGAVEKGDFGFLAEFSRQYF